MCLSWFVNINCKCNVLQFLDHHFSAWYPPQGSKEAKKKIRFAVRSQPMKLPSHFIEFLVNLFAFPFPSLLLASPLTLSFQFLSSLLSFPCFSSPLFQSFLVISSHLISSLLFISYLFTSFLFSAICSMVTYFTPSMLYSSLPLCLSSCLQHLKSNYYDSWQHEPPHTRVPSRLNTMLSIMYTLDYHPTPDKSLLTTTEYASILTTNLFPR